MTYTEVVAEAIQGLRTQGIDTANYEVVVSEDVKRGIIKESPEPMYPATREAPETFFGLPFRSDDECPPGSIYVRPIP